jgi:ribonuclease-3
MTVDLARKRHLRRLLSRLGLPTQAAAVVETALTHDSYAAEQAAAGRAVESNERLEFLGDAVLGAAVAQALYEAHPGVAEGRLSRMRAALVSREALARSAQALELGSLILLGRGERAAGGAQRPKILAAAFEALVGAVFAAGGWEKARAFVRRHHLERAPHTDERDPKTALQEYVQAKFKKAPHYAVTAQSGPPHARVFTVAVEVAGRVLGRGSGPTKKEAEAGAAREALAHLP